MTKKILKQIDGVYTKTCMQINSILALHTNNSSTGLINLETVSLKPIQLINSIHSYKTVLYTIQFLHRFTKYCKSEHRSVQLFEASTNTLYSSAFKPTPMQVN